MTGFLAAFGAPAGGYRLFGGRLQVRLEQADAERRRRDRLPGRDDQNDLSIAPGPSVNLRQHTRGSVSPRHRCGLTIGRHPMSLHRSTLALRGVLRAIDLCRRAVPAGRRIMQQQDGVRSGRARPWPWT